MDNPGTPSEEDRDEWTDRLVRPYVDYPGDDTNGSAEPADEPGASGSPGPAAPLARETAPLPAAMAGLPAWTGGPARGRRGPAASALIIAIGAAIVIVALAGGLLVLLLPDHSTTALASKCRSGRCQQIAPGAPGAVLPVTAASGGSAGAYPTSSTASSSARRAATSAATARRAAAPTPTTVIATVKPAASLTAAPSTAPTVAATRPAASPTATAPGLAPGSRISIRATTACCTSFYIGHDDRDNRVMITPVTSGSSTSTRGDATWIVQAGLADGSCVSFESANDPGQYLRYANFELFLDRGGRDRRFASEATFCPRPGNSGQGYSFQSADYPDEYIRHYDYIVYIASDGGRNPWDATALWPDDTSWLVSSPWG